MKQLFILLLATLLFAEPSTEQYAKLLDYAVCDEGVHYEKLTKTDHVAMAEQELLAVTKVDFKKMNDAGKIAFYSNLYNFYTIKLIVENYPLKSIMDLEKPWDQKIIPLWGKTISLNQLEHEIIRKEFDEPRIHFALNCASIGCPPLRTEPFTAGSLETQLEEQAHGFLNDTSRNRLEGKTLWLSKIFQWYGDDFNNKHGSYQEYAKKVLGIDSKVKVKFLEYDWNLNEGCEE